MAECGCDENRRCPVAQALKAKVDEWRREVQKDSTIGHDYAVQQFQAAVQAYGRHFK